MTNELKTINVVAAIIHDKKTKKILAVQRGSGQHKGLWEFPGGKVEKGETPEVALLREIHEELGITISVESLFEKVEYDYPEFHLSMLCFISTVQEGTPSLLEHSQARWVDQNNITKLNWLPADIDLAEQVKIRLLT